MDGVTTFNGVSWSPGEKLYCWVGVCVYIGLNLADPCRWGVTGVYTLSPFCFIGTLGKAIPAWDRSSEYPLLKMSLVWSRKDAFRFMSPREALRPNAWLRFLETARLRDDAMDCWEPDSESGGGDARWTPSRSLAGSVDVE